MKPRRTWGVLWITGGILLVASALAGCNYPGARPTQDQFATVAAKTVEAQLTLAADQTPGEAQHTATQEPAEGDTPTPTEKPTTPPSTDCTDKANFVKDVTVPDDTRLDPDEVFEKIWRLENTGTCTWTSDYALVFDSGNIMSGPPAKPLESTVAPGETLDVAVELTAPSTNGTHKGNWILRNGSGATFGLGEEADKPFWVQVVVGPTPTPKPVVIYDFTDSYCDATWTSGAGTLACPGEDSDNEGFVIKVNNPKLENGITENEPALWTHPQWVNDGVIGGTFPALDIVEGDHFRTVVGCLYKSGGSACNVKFQVTYSVDGDPPLILGQWTESYDGTIRKVDIDLASKGLAGKSVTFSLVVLANGGSNQDWGFWLVPRIEGPSR